MSHRLDVLLVAATGAELGGLPGLVCGVGPVEAAAATARALALAEPAAVLHVGIAGGSGLPVGAVVVGTASRYLDIEAAIPVVDEADPDPVLVAALLAALPGTVAAPVATSAAVGASESAVGATCVEGMEGFGVLRACALAGVPAVEVRVVSNPIGEDDRSLWDVAGALSRLSEVVPVALAAVERALCR